MGGHASRAFGVFCDPQELSDPGSDQAAFEALNPALSLERVFE